MKMEYRICKVCLLEKPAVKGSWRTSYGKPRGRTCLSCHADRSRDLKRQVRATEEGRAKSNAASVKCLTARLKVDAWYRLRQRLAVETRRLLKQLAAGKGTNAACIKLFGASRDDVLAHFNSQLEARGWGWSDYQILWQADHKVPFALAQTDDELRTLALLPNLQVLSPEENAIKAIADRTLVRQVEGE